MNPDPDQDPDPVIFVSDLQYVNNHFFSRFFCLLIIEGTVHLHNFSKIKSHKEVTKTVGINCFLTIFA